VGRNVPSNGIPASPVNKAVAIISCVAHAPAALSLAQLSGATALAKPTAHRLARLLERAGLVARDSLSRRYVVSPRDTNGERGP
jgi:IclR family transcriptional regulator, acetate operon repressor